MFVESGCISTNIGFTIILKGLSTNINSTSLALSSVKIGHSKGHLLKFMSIEPRSQQEIKRC